MKIFNLRAMKRIRKKDFFEKEYPGINYMLGQQHPEKVQPFTVNKGRIDLLIYPTYSYRGVEQGRNSRKKRAAKPYLDRSAMFRARWAAVPVRPCGGIWYT